MSTKEQGDPRFLRFKEDPSLYPLPKKFTYPFLYEPHPLAVLAADQLKEDIAGRKDWEHNFGLDPEKPDGFGKMFGVLVVKNQANELGFLAAFSGKLLGHNPAPEFVPLIFDRFDPNGFFRQGEKKVNHLNEQIEILENDSDLAVQQELLEKVQKEYGERLNKEREKVKQGKRDRKARRTEAMIHWSTEEYDELVEQLKKESFRDRHYFKELQKEADEAIGKQEVKVKAYTDKIKAYKQERKSRSGALQNQLFENYQFLNAKGEARSLKPIFDETVLKHPPAGAGDCAAPKLIQYAYQHQLQPIALAEFWWGATPKLEIRKHGLYYPACKGKCEPILGHMLKGLEVDENPLLQVPKPLTALEVVYDDDQLAVIHKPAEMLSVPGRNVEESVYTHMRQLFPKAKGPLIVHRLDMSTSGIMLIAKNSESYKHIQKQFIKRSIQKRYVAVLNGEISGNEGKIELPLMFDYVNRPLQMVHYELGKPAVTRWKVIEKKEGKTRIHFYPETGRTHQLRVHSAHHEGLNCPIVGDDLYGEKANRLHLHAEHIAFRHPSDGRLMEFTVPASF